MHPTVFLKISLIFGIQHPHKGPTKTLLGKILDFENFAHILTSKIAKNRKNGKKWHFFGFWGKKMGLKIIF